MENNFDTQGYLDMELLRFTTAGSVDDGKSTLIGRLLYDSKSIFEDQVQQIEQTSKKKGLEHVDLSLFTDGLKDEREQGITIDVAYRYFSTPTRKYIIADFQKLFGAAHATEIPLLTGNNKLVGDFGFLLYPRGPSKRFTSKNMMSFYGVGMF